MNQLKDFVKSVNEELHFLDEKEEIELTRDWSTPAKLESANLLNYKKVKNFSKYKSGFFITKLLFHFQKEFRK